MIDALKFCKTLFVDKIFGENCLIYENKLYAVHNEISIEIDCEIPFNCWVSFKLLSEILEKIKGKYVAVFENGTIIFTEIDTGIIYTIENVKPVTLTPTLPNLDAFANYIQSDLEIFKTIAKEAERYLKTTGEDLFTDSLLIGQNFICATDKNIILMGIEPLLKDEFAINIKQVQHLNKFNRCSVVEYYTSETELVLIHENGLRVFLPIKRHEIVGNNLNRVYKVAMSRYSKNWVEIPDFKSIKINALLANKKLTYLKLTNEYLESTNLKIDFKDYSEINFDKEFSIKLATKQFKTLLKLGNYFSTKDSVVTFVNKQSNIFGLIGEIVND